MVDGVAEGVAVDSRAVEAVEGVAVQPEMLAQGLRDHQWEVVWVAVKMVRL